MVRCARGLDKHGHERGSKWSDGNVTFQTAFESYVLSCRYGAGEAQYGEGRESQCDPTQRNETEHGNLHRSAIERKDIVPGAQTERRGGAGPVRGLLGGKDLTGRFVSRQFVR